MVASIPKGVYTMKGKMSIITKNAPRYRKGRKGIKSQLLDELSHLLNYNRKYLAFILRHAGTKVYTPQGVRIIADPKVSFISQRGRKKVYTREIIPPLAALWEFAGFISSVHLGAFININHDILFNHPKLKALPLKTKNKLLAISHATIDRLLKPVREKLEIRHRYHPNPHASWLKKSIPVQPYYDKPTNSLGYMELDLVHHCGESTRGEFAYTLTATEIVTGWTELRVIKNKAQVWTTEALRNIHQSVPFAMTALHSDNGSEFINAHIAKFVLELDIPFTRSREYHKNDSPYVESKNWSHVRVYTGYRRYDTDQELEILQPMMRLVSGKHNFFIPTMKVVEKHREGPKVYKRYTIDTPFNRIMNSGYLTEEEQQRLAKIRTTIDYFQLIKSIEDLKKKLDRAYQSKYHQGTL